MATDADQNASRDRRFQDQVALVTGSSRGIGRAIAVGLAREGATVVVNHSGRDEATASAVVTEIRDAGGAAIAVGADLAAPAACQELFDATIATFGRVDILVNNAGICPARGFLDMPLEVWQHVQDVNYRGTFLMSQLAARDMVARRQGGRIIAISSISALTGGSLQAHYTPTKAAVLSLMQSISIPLAAHGITCNSVLPGAIETEIGRDSVIDPDAPPATQARIPMGRNGQPEDVVGAVLFLASDEARYVTGASLLVDGGMFANLQ